MAASPSRSPTPYNAQLETRTVNGGFRFDYPLTLSGELSPRRGISTTLGSGGAPVRVRTTNGGLRLQRREGNGLQAWSRRLAARGLGLERGGLGLESRDLRLLSRAPDVTRWRRPGLPLITRSPHSSRETDPQ